jgi:hypothetical protein
MFLLRTPNPADRRTACRRPRRLGFEGLEGRILQTGGYPGSYTWTSSPLPTPPPPPTLVMTEPTLQPTTIVSA